MGKEKVVIEEKIGQATVKREYNVLNRTDMRVGDIIILAENYSSTFKAGVPVIVNFVDEDGDADEFIRMDGEEFTIAGYVTERTEKQILAATDYIQVDDKRYVLIDRAAKLDDTVLVVDNVDKDEHSVEVGTIVVVDIYSADKERLGVTGLRSSYMRQEDMRVVVYVEDVEKPAVKSVAEIEEDSLVITSDVIAEIRELYVKKYVEYINAESGSYIEGEAVGMRGALRIVDDLLGGALLDSAERKKRR